MTGRYGYTSPTNGDAFDVPGDIDATYAFWDARVGESATNAAALPAYTDRPGGHLVMTEDTFTIYLDTGAGWKPVASPNISWTPTWTGLTVGNGTQSFTYAVSGGYCTIVGSFTFGSTSAVTGTPSLTVPLTGTFTEGELIGVGSFIDASPSQSGPLFWDRRSGVNRLLYGAANGSPAAFYNGTVSSSNPITWTTGDSWIIKGTYRIA